MPLKKLILLLIPFLLFSCRKEKTFWDTNWKAPLVNDTLSLENYFNDSTLSLQSDHSVFVDLSRTILDIGLEDLVRLPDTTIYQIFTPAISLMNIPPGYQFYNNIEEHVISMGDVQLKQVTVSSGKIQLTVYNPTQTNVIYTIQLPGVTKNGVTFEKTYTVGSGTNEQPSVAVENLDISGYTIDLRGQQGLSFNKIQSKLIIQTDPNGSTVSINTSNQFKFDADISGIKLNYAKGYFGDNVLSDTSSFNVDLFNHVVSGALDVPLSELTFEIENGMKVALKGGITAAQNTNFQGSTIELNSTLLGNDVIINQAVGFSANLQPAKQEIVFNSSNSNIDQYFENLGNKHEIAYKLQLNPWGNTSGGNDEIFPESRIKVRVKTKMPLSVSLNQLTLRDTFQFNLNQDTDKTHIKSGNLVLNVSNTFPIACKPMLKLLDVDNNVLYELEVNGEISSGMNGTIDQKSGLLKMNSIIEVPLSENILSDIKRVKHILVDVVFNSPNPASGLNESQVIPFGAFLAMKMYAELQTEIRY